MICITCHHPDTAVTNSRPHKNNSTVWRRRQCTKCHATFTTVEVPKLELQIIDNNGSRPFSLSVLTVSISACFPHNQELGSTVAFDLANTILFRISEHGTASIELRTLVTTTYEVLVRFDKKAGLSYALRHNLPI